LHHQAGAVDQLLDKRAFINGLLSQQRNSGEQLAVELKAGFGKDGDWYKLRCYWSAIAEAAMKEAGSNTVRVAWGREDVEAIYHGA
jgi:hypothetical protein